MGFSPGTFALIGTAIGAVGTVMEASAARSAAQYQAAVAERNANIAEENMRREADRGQIEARDTSVEAGQQIAALFAEQGASGLGTQAGSHALRRRGLRQLSQRDSERIRRDSENQIDAFGQQAADFRGEAGMARSRARSSLVSGALNLGGTLVSGAMRHRRMTG